MSLLNTVDTALGAGFTLQLLAVPGFFNEYVRLSNLESSLFAFSGCVACAPSCARLGWRCCGPSCKLRGGTRGAVAGSRAR